MIKYIVIVASGALFSFALTPGVRAVAFRIGAVDVPGGRRVHPIPTPRLGGLVVFASILFSLGAGWAADPFIRHLFGSHPRRFAAAGLASAFLLIIGVIDDRRSVKPVTKLSAEIAAAMLVVAAGFRIHAVFGIEIKWLDGCATVLWIVAVTNAINMIDGLDGLAAGISLIISASLFSIACFLGSFDTAAILAALSGALLGFLCHNFYPARIFLGDSGSLLIGFLLGVTAIDSSNKAATVTAIVFPLLSLGLPLAEIALTTIRRALRWIRVVRLDTRTQRYEFSFFGGPALFTADREHIHHRLLAIGFTYRNAVIVLYALCAALGVASFFMVAHHVSSLALLLLAFGAAAFAARRLGYRELQPLSNGLLLPLYDLPSANRRVLYVLCDLGFIAASYLGACLIRSDSELSRAAMLPFSNALPVLAAAQIGCLVVAGLYRRSYRDFGIGDLLAIVKALALAVAGGWFALVVAGNWHSPALSLTILDGYLLATLVAGSRMSFKCLEYLFDANRTETHAAVIYGAGKGGVAILHEMRSNPSLGIQATAFIDDDAKKWNRMLHDITVQSPDTLEDLVNRRKIDVVIVATRKIPPERVNRITQRCTLAGIPVRMFHIGLAEVGREPKLIAQVRRAESIQA